MAVQGMVRVTEVKLDPSPTREGAGGRGNADTCVPWWVPWASIASMEPGASVGPEGCSLQDEQVCFSPVGA